MLDELDDLFENLDIYGPTNEQLYRMYGIYLNDFVKNELVIDGCRVIVNNNIVRDKNKGLFLGKHYTFNHLVTIESKISHKRIFDKYRANKIHWIRTILEQMNDKRILYFEKIDVDNVNKRYFWYKERNFIIVLKEIIPDVMLVTAFCTDEYSKKGFENDYKYYHK